MKKFSILFLIVVVICAGSVKFAIAQGPDFSVCPPSFVGSGARALGMGEAFVAIADDATAASWNPAGLVQLQKPEMSLVLSYEHRSMKYPAADDTIVRDSGSEESLTMKDLNYLSFAYPTSIAQRNVVFSLNYQYLYDFSRDF